MEKEAELILEPDHSEPRQQLEKSFNPQRIVAYLTVLTRPEIPWRSFVPIPIQDLLVPGVLIFHRTSEPAHPPKIGALEIEKYIHF